MPSPPHRRGPPRAPSVALERGHNLLLSALMVPSVDAEMAGLGACGGGTHGEILHREHIVIKYKKKILNAPFARGITAAVRALIIGSENMRNCLQLVVLLQLTLSRRRRGRW